MSDEEDESMSEGFSASEEEWQPGKDAGGGESSDDDDSDFEEVPTGSRSGRSSVTNLMKKDSKLSGVLKQQSAVKKRKPAGQSLRAKLYNRYRPPPKSLPSPSSGKNSPSASTSKGKSKNSQTPNEADNSDSDGSVNNYLVNPEEIDLRSSFYQNLHVKNANDERDVSPVFDCNAGIGNISDSDSEDNNESSHEEHVRGTNFDFKALLDNANSFEHMQLNVSKKKIEKETTMAAALDVNSLLALGEPEMKILADRDGKEAAVSKLCKTKSTRVKRHTKTRPTSTVDADDSEDSELEEVAETLQPSLLPDDSLEIQVELGQRSRRDQKKQTKEDLELALRRKINRNLKDRQLLLHKASLLCQFGRSNYFNRLLNDSDIMQKVLTLLPSKNAYPPQSGTEIKYFISFTTWFKTTIKLMESRMYPEHPRKKLKRKYLKQQLIDQIQKKQACCKQDMIFIYVALLRAMGLQCRLVVNLQPLPMKPSASDLLPLKLINDNESPGSKEKTSNGSAGKKENSRGGNSKKREKNLNESEESRPKVKKVKEEPSKRSTRNKKDSEKEMNSKREPRSTRNRKPLNSKKEEDSKKEELKNDPEKTENKVAETSQPEKCLNEIEEVTKEKEEPLKRSTRNKKDSGKEMNSEKEQRPSRNRKPLNSRKEEPKKVPEKADSKITETNMPEKVQEAQKDDQDIKKNVETVVPKRTSVRVKSILKEKQNINIPEIVEPEVVGNPKRELRRSSSRSVSPKLRISPKFMQGEAYKQKISPTFGHIDSKKKVNPSKVGIKLDFAESTRRMTRQRAKKSDAENAKIPQLDGADDDIDSKKKSKSQGKRPQLKKLNKSRSKEESDDDFQASPPKKPKAPKSEKKSPRAVLSSEEDSAPETKSPKKKSNATDIWVEAWSDVEECWVCIDIFTGKVHSVEAIRKSASSNLSYVYAFQNDLSIKDVTARYCLNWGNVVRKSRVDATWLNIALSKTVSKKTKRDLAEDQELRRIHEEKPLPTTISEYKDHPLYALERHLLKFQAIYPPNAPTLGFIRNEPVYSRDCVHTLHSRELWHRNARVVKPGEKAYKVVKARPKWDRNTQTVIKDQPLDIFGYWQTKRYEPPVAENGIVPRNEYGNVELFKECMLPKKCVHLRLPGLQRICKKLGIDCANAVVGFDFHQGACHPEYDGFIVCEEFKDTVIEAWHDDQRIQEEKEREKYEARVYGNWKKLIKGLLIRERLKTKYNF